MSQGRVVPKVPPTYFLSEEKGRVLCVKGLAGAGLREKKRREGCNVNKKNNS